MPYKSLDELPDNVKAMPRGAMQLFMAAFNGAWDSYADDKEQEAKSFAVANTAVSKRYKKVGEDWVEKSGLIETIVDAIRSAFVIQDVEKPPVVELEPTDAGVEKADYTDWLIEAAQQFIPKNMWSAWQKKARAYAGGKAYKPQRELSALQGITPEKLKGLKDGDLGKVHSRLHAFWGAVEKGGPTVSDVHTDSYGEFDSAAIRRAHKAILAEMLGREMAHEVMDNLDEDEVEKGGAGSGNFGHEGRPGEVGGSGGGGGAMEGGASGGGALHVAQMTEQEFVDWKGKNLGEMPPGLPKNAYYPHTPDPQLDALEDKAIDLHERVKRLAGIAPRHIGEHEISKMPKNTKAIYEQWKSAKIEYDDYLNAHTEDMYRQEYRDIQGWLAGRASKSADLSREAVFVHKDARRQIVYGVVYEPLAVDTQLDWASADEIEKAEHGFMKAYRKMGVRHTGTTLDSIVPVESYIAPCDFWFEGTPQDEEHRVKKGSWVLAAHIADSEAWQDVESGKLTGFSLFGKARRKRGSKPA
jgi:cation transport regulator ChaB